GIPCLLAPSQAPTAGAAAIPPGGGKRMGSIDDAPRGFYRKARSPRLTRRDCAVVALKREQTPKKRAPSTHAHRRVAQMHAGVDQQGLAGDVARGRRGEEDG